MITKLASLYYNGNDCFSVKNTKGFNKAILQLTAPEGCTVSYLYIQKSIDSTAPSITIKDVFENRTLIDRGLITPSTGRHTYIIDISGSTSIRVGVRDDAETQVPVTNVSLCLMQVPVDEYETDATTMLLSDTQVSVNVQEYNSAYIMLHVPENVTSIIRPYVTYDGTKPNYSSTLFGLYCGGVKLIDQETRFRTGDYVLYAEFKGETNFLLSANNGATLEVLLTKNALDIKDSRTIVNTASSFTLDSSTCNSLKITVVNEENNGVQLLNQDNSNIPLYVSGVKSVTGWRMNTGDVIYADCRGCTKVTFSKGCNIIVEQSDNIVSDELLESGTVCKDSPYYVVEQGKQVDFTISKINASSFKVSLQGSNDDFVNTTDIGILDVDTNRYATQATISNRNNAKLYANIEGYKNVRLAFTFVSITHKAVVTSQVHQDYLEGRVIGNIGNGVSNLLTGYKYFKFRFLKEGYINSLLKTAAVDECDVTLDIRNNGEKCYDLLKFYDRGMNLLGYNFAASGILLGTPSDGGFIVTINSVFSNNVSITFRTATISEATKCILPYELSCYVNPPAAEPCLTKVRERADYTIYELPSQEQDNRDVLNEDVLEWSDNSLIFWHCGYLGVRYDIPFNVSNVAHFVDGETIKFAYLLPYDNGDRVGRLYRPSRIVVFTNTRVFHNYPERQNSNRTDLFRFDESIIYNKYKWQPVNDLSKVNNFRKYFPVLKDYDYDQFEYRVATTGYYKVEVNTDDELPAGVEPIENAIPIQETGKYDSTAIGDITLPDIYNRVVIYYKSNGDDTYTSWKITTLDPYGNGGLPNTTCLQDALTETGGIWNRIKYSSMTKCQKYCAFGNYNGMYKEPVVMMTNDGGKRWYVRAYFAVTDFYYNQGPGSGIDLTPITDVAGAYITNSLRMCRKRFNIPTAEIKEPATPFIIDDNDKSLVTGFSVNDNGDCVVTLADDVDYDGSFPIVYFENVNASSEWNYICNDSVTASSGGNNIFFRAQKVTANQYILYADTGNPNEGDMVCRHIHAVNAVECGVLISTGESYGVNPANWFEGGFLYIIKQTENNGGSAINVNYNNTELDVVTRLTSSPLGVNRASGAFLFSDNADPTLLYVSDESFTVKENHKRYAALPSGRTQMLPLTPGGIYVGKLSDIDEQAKFKCVCETKGTVVGLTENKGHFAADGHENAICLSKNGFDWTIEEDTRSYVNGADNKGNIYFGNKVAVFK